MPASSPSIFSDHATFVRILRLLIYCFGGSTCSRNQTPLITMSKTAIRGQVGSTDSLIGAALQGAMV